jgi:ATP-binding cassette subfamily B protein
MILEDGKILENGKRTELAANPESRFRHLLDAGLEEVLA